MRGRLLRLQSDDHPPGEAVEARLSDLTTSAEVAVHRPEISYAGLPGGLTVMDIPPEFELGLKVRSDVCVPACNRDPVSGVIGA